MSHKKISVNHFFKLKKIFEEKEWTAHIEHQNVFETICLLLLSLNQEQSTLILELLERYHWISFNDYDSFLRKVLKDMRPQLPSGCENIYIFPIIKKSDEDKTKSGNQLMYLINSRKPILSEYSNIKFKLLSTFENLTSCFPLPDKTILLLVDDYIGSGDTLKGTLDELKKNDHYSLEKTHILSLFIGESTKKQIIKEVKNIHFHTSLKKGITECYTEPTDLAKKVEIMDQIESKIPGVKGYRFGYNKSEALITLLRTPNNTFPIFWKDQKNKTKAPFPRH